MNSESYKLRCDKDEGNLHYLESWPGHREPSGEEEEKESIPQQGAEREGGKT